jgi:hypothetical protein
VADIVNLKLIASGAKLKDVADSTVVSAFLLGSLIEVLLKDKPDLADQMAEVIRALNTPEIKPEYRVLIGRALETIGKV